MSSFGYQQSQKKAPKETPATNLFFRRFSGKSVKKQSRSQRFPKLCSEYRLVVYQKMQNKKTIQNYRMFISIVCEMTEIFSVKGQMGSREQAKTLFPCLCLQPRRSAPQRIKNGERFYEKYMSILCINEIFIK